MAHIDLGNGETIDVIPEYHGAFTLVASEPGTASVHLHLSADHASALVAQLSPNPHAEDASEP